MGGIKLEDAIHQLYKDEETIKNLEEEIERLKEKCNKQANLLMQLTPEKFPGIMFIHAHLGEKDINGMPEKILMIPTYGSDVTYIYERKDRNA
jgi:hypothetical protein